MPNAATRRIVLTACTIGFCTTAVGVTAQVARSLGLIPASLYLSGLSWTSSIAVAGIPLEFLGAAWFLAVALLFVRAQVAHRAIVTLLVFLTSSPIVGFGIWFWIARGRGAWTVSGAAVAAAAVLIALILDSHAWTQASVSAIRRELAIVWATSRVRAEVAAFAAVVGVTAAVIHVSAQRVTPEAAYGRSLLRWYASQTPVSDSELTSAAGLRVVVFTDYAAVDRHIVPGVINAVAELRARGALVDLVVRHLPGGRECNQEVRIRSDPAGCAAAYAATLVRGAGDEASTFAVGRWLYARGPALTRKIIQQYLEGLGLDKKFEADYASLKESVDRDIRYARRLGVRGTPTFFVNGVRMPAGRGAVERVLEYEFERSQGGPKLGLD